MATMMSRRELATVFGMDEPLLEVRELAEEREARLDLLAVVDEQDVDQLQRLGQLAPFAADPEVHGVATGELDVGHAAPHLRLQHRVDVGEKEESRVRELGRNLRLEVFEDVQLGEVRP